MMIRHFRACGMGIAVALAGAAAAQAQTAPTPRMELPPPSFHMPMELPDVSRAIEAAMEMRFMWEGPDREDRQTDAEQRQRESEQRQRDREARAYDEGRELLDQGKYDRAAERFTDVASMKGSRVDAALYFKAWAQNKAGQRADALSTIATLAKEFPKSRYLTQARALESEGRRDSGQPVRPESESDDDLKLMALNALQNSDPESAIPMLEKLLEGTASPRLKSKALFVLAQSNSP